MSAPTPIPSTTLEQRIEAQAIRLGFDAIGFCGATLRPEIAGTIRAFVASQHHGTMHWLEERIEQRADPKTLWPEVRSVITLGLSYAPGQDATKDPANHPLATLSRPDCGNISLYARHRDYHDVMKGMLKHLAQFVVKAGGDGTQVKVFVDTAPVSERDLAEKAQMGWRGKHGCIVSRHHGSWLFLGEIFTTLSLTPSSPPQKGRQGQCGTCTRCLTACPTNAFIASPAFPGQMDARRCISYLTIEHQGPIPHALRPLMGNRIYGCDDCLAVCPWNRFAQQAQTIKFHARAEHVSPSLAVLSQFDDKAFRQHFSGSPVKRIGRNRFIRNVLIAIGNSGQKDLLSHAQRLQSDPDPDIAETARWATSRLKQHPTRIIQPA